MAGKLKLMTRSSATLSLFAEPSNLPRRPSTFVLSMFVHAAVAGVMYYGVTHLPRIDERTLLEHYSVRQVNLRDLDPNFPNMPQLHDPESKIPYPGADVIARLKSAPSPELTEEMRSFLGSAAGRQTLIQPEIHSQLSFADQVPLPNIMIWAPELEVHKKIVPILPSSPSLPIAQPSLAAPNHEMQPAPVNVAATELSSRSVVVPAGTTSPLMESRAKPAQIAISSFASLEEATPAAVLSISEFRMPDGTVQLPPVNEVAAANPGANGGGIGSQRDGNLLRRVDDAKRTEVDDLAIDGRRLSSEHIVLPRNGRFNVVVVGSSLAEEYPETVNIWANRVAYTAYLHVGLKKNWILQYSATRAAEVADGGRVERLVAPWPYDILRPNLLSRDLHAEALMVHGVLNRTGRLESLAIAFPSSFRYASFVLHELGQWQFRPALENGQATPVEVLLIIPEEMD